ncbi:hypothetical protein P280DRAFT_469474 [Massarina eburnea CBS 473.64]|uniref:Uncharacterized protein n=1 Tax=Massarina eburnea CBS 473.64 TaxID=1395130 RepID=A0A6A6S269_9PLEO|nr:hypothetical protein P280DRAFT_469474 [Massarina eburnea CBS 473.64]
MTDPIRSHIQEDWRSIGTIVGSTAVLALAGVVLWILRTRHKRRSPSISDVSNPYENEPIVVDPPYPETPYPEAPAREVRAKELPGTQVFEAPGHFPNHEMTAERRRDV